MHERSTGVAARINPVHEGIRLSATLLGQRNRSISGGVLTLRCNCLKRCIEVSLVRIKDLHNVWVRITIEQLERVGPGGQNLSRDLDWLTKRNGGSLI